MKAFETWLTRALDWTVGLLLLAMAAIIITLVVLRYVFNSSITGANELATLLFVYTTALGAAVAIGRREHIAIPFAVEALSTSKQRFADVAALLLVALINGVMLGYSVGWIRITGAYLMPATGLPRVVAQISVPLGCSLAILYCLLRLISPKQHSVGKES